MVKEKKGRYVALFLYNQDNNIMSVSFRAVDYKEAWSILEKYKSKTNSYNILLMDEDRLRKMIEILDKYR